MTPVQMKELSTRFSLSLINLSKLVKHFTSALFFHSLHIALLDLLLLSPLVALLSPLILKLQTDRSIIMLLLGGTVCRLIDVTLLIMSLFTKSYKTISIAVLFISSLYSSWLYQDWYIWYWLKFYIYNNIQRLPNINNNRLFYTK